MRALPEAARWVTLGLAPPGNEIPPLRGRQKPLQDPTPVERARTVTRMAGVLNHAVISGPSLSFVRPDADFFPTPVGHPLSGARETWLAPNGLRNLSIRDSTAMARSPDLARLFQQPDLENHWVPMRNRALPSVMAFVAQATRPAGALLRDRQAAA